MVSIHADSLNCRVCDHLRETKVVTSVKCSATGATVKIKSRLACTIDNVVYCMTCKRETDKQMKQRARGTVIQQCQENTTAPAGVHFRYQGHTVCDLEIIPIAKARHCCHKESSMYIDQFDSDFSGLNVRK